MLPDPLSRKPDDSVLGMRLVGQTKSIAEAEMLADQYRSKGFATNIVKKTVGSVILYEVYAGKGTDDILTADSNADYLKK